MGLLSRRLITLCLAGMASFGAFAGLPMEQMEARLKELEIYRNNGLDLEGIVREAVYEVNNVPVEQRAWMESQLLVQALREAVLKSYFLAIEDASESEDPAAVARDLIRANMEKDMPLLAPELQADMKAIVEDVLANPKWESSELPMSETLLANMKVRSQNRLALLSKPISVPSDFANLADRKGSGSKITSKVALVAALAGGSSPDNFEARYNTKARSSVSLAAEAKFSAQIKASFMGIEIAAGPTFTFTKTVSSAVQFGGEGFAPIFDGQGRFDLVKRGSNGQPVMVNGRAAPRRVAFSCELTAEVESEASLAGGFSAMGVGPEARVVKTYRNQVELDSSDLLVPDTLDGRLTTVSTLASICQRDFLNARSSNGRTIGQNLDTMIRNLVSSLTYVNPAMKCVINSHCNKWFNNEVLGIHKYKTVPRCIQERGNASVMTCQLRGGAGANCKVIRENKVVSSGYFEYPCDTGKRCVVTEVGGWGGLFGWTWTPWKGECR
jgi:hypothetical protein